MLAVVWNFGTEILVATNPLTEIRNIRIGKADAMRHLGLSPYPAKSGRTHYSKAVVDQFAELEGLEVTVAGRLMSFRKQGALAFAHVQDQTGRLQFFFRKQRVKPTDATAGWLGFADIGNVDLGDIVEATGTVMRTERGEISLMVEGFRLLTKALRPLPDQWAGLKDRETILRKRYLDVILTPESQERFASITRMIAAIRTFLNGRGFMEFTTPAIQPQYGGGTAKPFKTHVNALGCDMYLAISHELYLKRLVTAGYDKVYTIGRYFRNEGIDRSHHPEFSMVETMTAYENYEYNMDLIEDMFRFIAQTAFGKTQFNVRGHMIDFANPWKRLAMADAVLDKTGVDFRTLATVGDAHEVLRRLNVAEAEFPATIGESMVRAFEVAVEPSLIEPTLVHGHPIEISPLAKPMASDPRFVERFEIFIAGMECGDNWSEQNDPVSLFATWKKRYRPEERDSGEFHALDLDFIEALEYGLPPTTGIGPGLERMAMIFTEQENIDDVIFFPLMKPSISSFNAATYGVEERPMAPVEDLALTLEEFKVMLAEGSLMPTSKVSIKPHVRMFPAGSRNRVSGHLEVEGIAHQGVIHLSGYTATMETIPDMKVEAKKLGTMVESVVVEAIKVANPHTQIKLIWAGETL